MASLNFKQEWLSDTTVVEAHTSGSTGKPKRILLPKSDMRASARATNKFFGIDADSVLALPLSVDYIAGKMMVVRACEARCKLIELPVSNDIVIPDSIDQVDLLPVVPSQIDSLLSHPALAFKIRNVLIGGASPSAEACRMLTLAGYNAYISYGMTETCSHVALARADDKCRVFHAMPGISFDVDSDDRLIINAPSFSFKSLLTNDIVTLTAPDAMIWRGRADSVINSGGIKLIPEELEAIYSQVLEGRTFFVKAIPDKKWGQAVALVIEGNETENDTISVKLASAIQDHKLLPKQIIFVPEIALTPNGKIKRGG